MRAIEVAELSGLDGVRLAERERPEPSDVAEPGSGVLIDVHACGLTFPDVLLTRGAYQLRPDPPFVLGLEVAGTVVAAAPDAGFEQDARVAAMIAYGGLADRVVVPSATTYALPDELDFIQGAALTTNYHTAWFALHRRGRLRAGETVLVHGAAGGIGTAALQLARAAQADTIVVVSSEAKAAVARDAGADAVVLAGGSWRERVAELAPRGVDVVLDPVGGDRFIDSIRSLAEEGRLIVVGFAGGSIPEVKANRLLLRNSEVVGAALGAFVSTRPEVAQEIGAEVNRLVRQGVVRPLVGNTLPMERTVEGLRLIEGRAATGKVVIDLSARASD